MQIIWDTMRDKNKIASYQHIFQHNLNGLVQEKRNSIANALELHLSCINPLI